MVGKIRYNILSESKKKKKKKSFFLIKLNVLSFSDFPNPDEVKNIFPKMEKNKKFY